MEKNKCKKCGYEWQGRVENPVECPKCKNRNWKEDKNLMEESEK